jgi:hypothetical protein
MAGSPMLLDAEALPKPEPVLVAFRRDTKTCKVLTKDDVESGEAARWAQSFEVTFHHSHFATCPQADEWRK